MRHKPSILLITILTLIGCDSTSSEKQEEQITLDKQKAIPSIVLEHVWSTDTVLTTAESAIYDKERNVIYVSNIDGSPWESDGEEFISKVNLIGEVTEMKWVAGLNAPKGWGSWKTPFS